MIADFAHLRGFLGSYFHQDWDLDDATPAAVVKRFCSESSVAERSLVCEDLLRILDFATANEFTDDFMVNELWCYYWPGRDGMSDIAFFQWLLGQLREP
jgi:CdiI immunity protein